MIEFKYHGTFKRHQARFCALLCSLMAGASGEMTAKAEPIQFAGEKSELIISEVSERMARVDLLHLDQQGIPRPSTASTILVSFPATQKFRTRELNTEAEISVGSLRLMVKPQPFTISVRHADGKLVQ